MLRLPVEVIIDEALRRRPTSIGIVTALRDAGWHLVSTPELEERSTVELSWDPPGREMRLSVIADGTVFNTAQRVTGQMLHQAAVDVGVVAKRMMGARLAYRLGDHIGLPGCEEVVR